jgi:hypothetical protein
LVLLSECYSLYRMRDDRMGGTCGTYWYEINTYRVLVRVPEGKRLLGRSRCRWHVLVGDTYVQGFVWGT